MKLADLSYREYIALEALPGILGRAGTLNSMDAVEKAFKAADAFLIHAGKHEDRVAHAEARALAAEGKLSVLQSIHLNMGEDFAARVALTQIWEALGVANQTMAMHKIGAIPHAEISHDRD